MSFSIKSHAPKEIHELVQKYHDQFGIYLLDSLLVRKKVVKYFQIFNVEFTINENHVQSILQNMTQWKLFQLIVRPIFENQFLDRQNYIEKFCRRPKIVGTIAHISFPYLQKLQLDNCNLTSIEILQFLDCSRLIQISLNTNFISFLKPLSKACFPKIKRVDLCRNKFPTQNLNVLRRTVLFGSGEYEVHQIERKFYEETFFQRCFSIHEKWTRISSDHQIYDLPRVYLKTVLNIVQMDFNKYFSDNTNDEVVQVHFSKDEKDWGQDRISEIKLLLREFKQKVEHKFHFLNKLKQKAIKGE